MNKLKAITASPVDREDVVIEVYYENYFLFEINSENKKIQAEFYLNEGKFVVEIDHLINMLDTTQILLTRKEGENCKIGSFLVVNNNEVVSIFTHNNSLFAKGLKKGSEFLFQICFNNFVNFSN